MRAARLGLAAALLLLPGAAPAAGLAPDEVRVAGGTFYVGQAMGERDYRKLANASTPGFLILRGPVTQGLADLLTTWGTLHGYAFEGPCAGCGAGAEAAPASGVSWRDAVLLANALSEADGLDPVYRDGAGQPVRSAVPPEAVDHAVVETSLSGYRLPTSPEWQIAMRGAGAALALGSYGADPTGTNALGLTGTAGPLAEWTGSSMDLGQGRQAQYLACNGEVDGVRRLSRCDLRPAGATDPGIGFRFLRRLPR